MYIDIYIDIINKANPLNQEEGRMFIILKTRRSKNYEDADPKKIKSTCSFRRLRSSKDWA
jgi:hypothetical protein